MTESLAITAEWERLDEGSPEERACFAAVHVSVNGQLLTHGYDGAVRVVRSAPLVSAYHLAEWLAWNWWRLRWEPARKSADWLLAHRVASIGEGYLWPNISFVSDGRRVSVEAKPSYDQDGLPFSYLADTVASLDARAFELGVEAFIAQVIGRLRSEGVADTNLCAIWSELVNEREDPEAAKARRLEALFGYDPDEAPQDLLGQTSADAQVLGLAGVEELAAATWSEGKPPRAEDLRDAAQNFGQPTHPDDSVRAVSLDRGNAYQEAWQLAADVAATLRAGEGLGSQPVSDARLARMAGASTRALAAPHGNPPISFFLEGMADGARVVLRSHWRTGRRFDLARLVGDRLWHGRNGALFPATSAQTFRQKFQRAFAAELLSPFEVINDMLAGDYSDERQEDIARHFNVSPLTIRTQLVNRGRLGRDALVAGTPAP